MCWQASFRPGVMQAVNLAHMRVVAARQAWAVCRVADGQHLATWHCGSVMSAAVVLHGEQGWGSGIAVVMACGAERHAAV